MTEVFKFIFRILGMVMIFAWLGSCSIGLYRDHNGANALGVFAFIAAIFLFEVSKPEE